MKKHYWRVIAVCFIIAFISGNYEDTFSAVLTYDSSREVENVVQDTTFSSLYDIRSEKPLDRILDRYAQKNAIEEEIVKNSPYTRGVFSSIYNYTVATGSIFSGIISMLLKPILKGAWLSLIAAIVLSLIHI